VTAKDETNSGYSETVLLEEEALTDESSYDKLMSRGNIAAVPAALTRRQTDWQGLTIEEEETARKRKDQEAREEYDRAMAQVRIRSEEIMRRLDEQEREVHKRMAEADGRAIVLQDGRRVLVGRHGEYIDETTGTKLEGADAAEAQGKKRADSETEEEHTVLRNQLGQIQEAREHARRAADLAGQNDANLSPAEKQQREKQAGQELGAADELSREAATRQKHLESNPDAASALTGTDTLAALGVGDPGARTTSFAASLEAKTSQAATIRPEFTAKSNPSSVPIPAASTAADASPVAATQNRVMQPG